MAENGKAKVCVTGGTGFIASWLVKKLLEQGYFVNATTRIDPDHERDLSYLTNLNGAADRLKIFNADLGSPESFIPAFEGCIGVFHVAHPLDFSENETEEVKLRRLTTGVKAILKACADSKTVKRVVYTSSISAVSFGDSYGSSFIDENSWSDVELIRSWNTLGGPYFVTKTVTEKLAFNLAQELGVDLVSVCPTWVTGPFLCPYVPDSVYVSLALVNGSEKNYKQIKKFSLVHVDDVAKAHIHVFEHPEAKGRYICAASDVTIEELHDFFSKKYPEFDLPKPESWKDVVPLILSGVSSKKLLETGFKYEYGLEEMLVEAVECCKQKGYL